MVRHVESNPVTVGDEGDRSGVNGLRSDMAHAQAGGAAGEPAVGEQQHVLAQAGALDRTGDGQHLAHSRTTLGALVADHHHVTFGDGAVLEGVHGCALTVENPCGAFEYVRIEAGRLDHRALRRQ